MKRCNHGCTVSLDWLGLLTIVLVVLKATGHLHCSWWWVFAPIWAPVALVLCIIVFAGLVGALCWIGLFLIAVKRGWRNRRD